MCGRALPIPIFFPGVFVAKKPGLSPSLFPREVDDSVNLYYSVFRKQNDTKML